MKRNCRSSWCVTSICPACWPLRPRFGAIGRTLNCLRSQGLTFDQLSSYFSASWMTSRRSRSPVMAAFAWCRPVADDLGLRGIQRAAAEQRAVIMEVSECLDASVTCPRNGDGNKSTLLFSRPSIGLAPVHLTARSGRSAARRGRSDEFLFLADGGCLIDGISSWWTILHGHRHPVFVWALCEAVSQN